MFFDVLLSILIVVVRENREFHRQVLGTLLILVLATSTIATVLCGRNTMAVSQVCYRAGLMYSTVVPVALAQLQ
jgi:hypothetical protein